MKKTLLLLALSLVPAIAVRADGDPSNSQPPVDQRTGAEKVGADASVADDRLPPVFPGEEVNDGKNTIKTWSTSGPVPVSQAPEPWRNGTNYGLGLNGGIGVLVDGRRSDTTSPPPPPGQ